MASRDERLFVFRSETLNGTSLVNVSKIPTLNFFHYGRVNRVSLPGFNLWSTFS